MSVNPEQGNVDGARDRIVGLAARIAVTASMITHYGELDGLRTGYPAADDLLVLLVDASMEHQRRLNGNGLPGGAEAEYPQPMVQPVHTASDTYPLSYRAL